MSLMPDVLVLVVAAIHVYILVLEMFLWQTPRGMKSFGTDPEFAARSATLAANQGLYNGFLAAGLAWGVLVGDPLGTPIKLFFLGCVIVAGLYGAATVSKRILVVQALPAAIARPRSCWPRSGTPSRRRSSSHGGPARVCSLSAADRE